ncbi:hypothetical protein BKI52_07250 [marine bacterium AO1-C]|nr:hypothetical protein BKI52_07250 [marine bacterium AO1-C]
MKLKINLILPIALAVILPGLSFYSNTRPVIMQYNENIYKRWIVVSVILYILWYFLWYLLTPKTTQRKWALGVMGFALITINYGMFNHPDFTVNIHNLVRFFLAGVIILVVQYAVRAQQNVAQLRVEKEQMQTENYKVQLKALRTKVDPHFLFNSLNTLRSMVRQQHQNSEQFIISLSDFYRQILRHNENTTLLLSEELIVLQAYLFLMKSRNEEAVLVNLTIDESLHSWQLPSLALQVVVENCFKHNSMTSKMPLRIKVSSTQDGYIEVSNNVQPRLSPEESSGYGLDLLRKRYALMNIEQGVLIQEDETQFSVQLKLIKDPK